MRIRDDEEIPADCIILAQYTTLQEKMSVDYKKGQKDVGEVSVQTTMIDGTVNLEQKLAIKQIDEVMKGKEIKFQNKLTKLRGLKIYAEAPSSDMEHFSGNISLLGGGVHKDMDIRHFLLKGSVLKNSGMVDAMVIFTGEDTKIQMNWSRTQFRWSHLDISINWITLCNAITLFVLLLICSLSKYIWLKNHVEETDKVDNAFLTMPANTASFGEAMGMFFLLFRLLIPFEVVVVLEFAKWRYSNLVEQDSHLYNIENGKSI